MTRMNADSDGARVCDPQHFLHFVGAGKNYALPVAAMLRLTEPRPDYNATVSTSCFNHG